MSGSEKEVEVINLITKGINIDSPRKSAKTTRLADAIIQTLLKGKEVTILEPYRYDNYTLATEYLINRILKRLDSEHGMTEKHIEYKIVDSRHCYYHILMIK